MKNVKDVLAFAGTVLAVATILFAMTALPGLLSDRDSSGPSHPIVVIARR